MAMSGFRHPNAGADPSAGARPAQAPEIVDLTSSDEEDDAVGGERAGSQLMQTAHPLHSVKMEDAKAGMSSSSVPKSDFHLDVTKQAVERNAQVDARTQSSVPDVLDHDALMASTESYGNGDGGEVGQDDLDSESERGINSLIGDDNEDSDGDDDMIEDIIGAIKSDSDSESLGDRSNDPEHLQVHQDLLILGVPEFVRKYLESGSYTPTQLCEIFGCDVRRHFGDGPETDELALGILGKILQREISRRRKLPQYNTLDDAADLVRSAKRILVLTGAGISTSLGIPDFRSKDGLYAQLAKSGYADVVDDPQDVFALDVFRQDPKIFYSVAKNILSSDKRFSPTHAFIRLLQDKDKLQTNFTQNIDNLEAAAGIKPEKLVHCHGSFAKATCQKCGVKVNGDDIHDEVRRGDVPRCKSCLKELASLRVADTGIKRKRSSAGISVGLGFSKQARKSKSRSPKHRNWEDGGDTDEDDDIEDLTDDAAGVMKPDIIFFGEDLPSEFHDRAINDKEVVDLVIVIGTSLKVAPVSDVPNFIAPNVPQIYISRDPCRHIDFDVELLGECDVVCAELCKRAGWNLSHEMLPVGGYDVEVNGHEGKPGRHDLKVKGVEGPV